MTFHVICLLFVFFADRQALTSGPRHRVHPNGTLVVRRVRKGEDEGSYGCRAEGRDGKEARGETMVSVIGRKWRAECCA